MRKTLYLFCLAILLILSAWGQDLEFTSAQETITLDLSLDDLTSVPPEIGKVANLEWLSLPINKLTSLPTEIGNLSTLHVLYLYRNELTTLPETLTNLTNLSTLVISDNHLVSLNDPDLIAFLDRHDPDWRETQTSP